MLERRRPAMMSEQQTSHPFTQSLKLGKRIPTHRIVWIDTSTNNTVSFYDMDIDGLVTSDRVSEGGDILLRLRSEVECGPLNITSWSKFENR
ncbi:MAG: hypothetical protein ACI8R6_000168 [Candidatus Paceibacteria bacterium]|jgi:hypothetical protein